MPQAQQETRALAQCKMLTSLISNTIFRMRETRHSTHLRVQRDPFT